MTADDPRSITVQCPACNAAPFRLCTAPTDTGRRLVQWFHLARTEAATTEAP